MKELALRLAQIRNYTILEEQEGKIVCVDHCIYYVDEITSSEIEMITLDQQNKLYKKATIIHKQCFMKKINTIIKWLNVTLLNCHKLKISMQPHRFQPKINYKCEGEERESVLKLCCKEKLPKQFITDAIVLLYGYEEGDIICTIRPDGTPYYRVVWKKMDFEDGE